MSDEIPTDLPPQSPPDAAPETPSNPPEVPESPPPPPQEPPPGPLEALTGVLFAPSATFARMGGGRWVHLIFPLLLMGFLAGLASFTFMKRVDMEQFVRDQLRHNRFASKMSDAQMDEAVEKGKDANPYTRSGVTVPVTALWLLLVGLVYWAAFLAMGASLNYIKTMQVVAWAQVPYWINSLLAMGVFFLKDPNDLDPMNPVFSNPAAFLDRESVSGGLHALLGSFDLFGIWVLILYILGFSALGKVSKGKAAAIVIAIFVLKVLLKSGFAAVFTV